MQDFETALTGLAPEINSIQIIIDMPRRGEVQVTGSIWDRTTYRDREVPQDERIFRFTIDPETNRRYVERLAEQDGWTIGEWETYDMTVFASESDVLTATR